VPAISYHASGNFIGQAERQRQFLIFPSDFGNERTKNPFLESYESLTLLLRGPISRLKPLSFTIACTLSHVASLDITTLVSSKGAPLRLVILISDHHYKIPPSTGKLSPNGFCSILAWPKDTINFFRWSNVRLPDKWMKP
jgi:hypothetical protein